MKTCKETRLQNGLTVLTVEDLNSMVATLSLSLRAGSRYEGPNESGYAHLIEHMILKGTKKRPSAESVGLVADRAGALLAAETNINYINIVAQSVNDHIPTIIELLADLVINPLFNEKTLENEKRIIIQEIHRARDNRSILWFESTSRLFGEHPLGNNVLGDGKTIQSATSGKLRTYYSNFFTPNRAVLIINGNMDSDKLIALIENDFAKWKNNNEIKERKKFPIPHKGEIFIRTPGKQTQLYFNFVCLNVEPKILIGLKFLAHILGYGKAPFLKQELRHKSGLIYSLGVNIIASPDAALFYISTASTEPKEVVEIVKKTINDFENALTERVHSEFQSQYRNFLMRVSVNPFTEIDILREFWMAYGILMPLDKMIKIISSLGHQEILNIKNKCLSEKKLFITEFGEVKS
jgi:predicted Zn-dependent peptidase